MPTSEIASQQPATGSHLAFSPYRAFPREEWAKLRADTPMTLVSRELKQLSGVIEDLSMNEVEQIYLPLSRLLNLHVAAAQELHTATSRFLGRKDRHVPYILGVSGSPAVGKSTMARVLQARPPTTWHRAECQVVEQPTGGPVERPRADGSE